MTQDVRLRADLLKKLKEKGDEAAVYLTNGVKLTGKVVDFDHEGVLLSGNNKPNGMFVSFNATATITNNDTNGGRNLR